MATYIDYRITREPHLTDDNYVKLIRELEERLKILQDKKTPFPNVKNLESLIKRIEAGKKLTDQKEQIQDLIIELAKYYALFSELEIIFQTINQELPPKDEDTTTFIDVSGKPGQIKIKGLDSSIREFGHIYSMLIYKILKHVPSGNFTHQINTYMTAIEDFYLKSVKDYLQKYSSAEGTIERVKGQPTGLEEISKRLQDQEVQKRIGLFLELSKKLNELLANEKYKAFFDEAFHKTIDDGVTT